MDEKYISFFEELAHTNELLAEQVMELNHSKNDEQGEHTAQIMRDDYNNLTQKIKTDATSLDKNDYIKLLVAALVVSNNLLERIKSIQNAINGYKTDVIPKLQRIVNEVTEEEQLAPLVKELFSIEK